jgi:hypothetical protein
MAKHQPKKETRPQQQKDGKRRQFFFAFFVGKRQSNRAIDCARIAVGFICFSKNSISLSVNRIGFR